MCAAAIAVALNLVASVAAAPSHATANFGLYPQIFSNSQPTIAGTNFQYFYTVNSGDSFNQTINVIVCLDSASLGSATSWNDQVVMQKSTGDTTLLGDITLPASSPWSFDNTVAPLGAGNAYTTGSPTCQTGTVTIDGTFTNTGTTPLTLQANIFVQTQNRSPSTGSSSLLDGFDTGTKIQISVIVNPPAASNIACYMTDSEANLLTDCSGNYVTASGDLTDGKFLIVTNHGGTEVSTNPGQFYYNLLWTNTTGSDQTVQVTILATGAMPVGANALHWWTFSTTGFAGVTSATFDQVNAGNPIASENPGVFDVTVPAGQTLYVTDHLQWSGIGQSPPANCGHGCGNANQELLVAGTVSSTSGAFADENCSSGALGYLKE